MILVSSSHIVTASRRRSSIYGILPSAPERAAADSGLMLMSAFERLASSPRSLRPVTAAGRPGAITDLPLMRQLSTGAVTHLAEVEAVLMPKVLQRPGVGMLHLAIISSHLRWSMSGRLASLLLPIDATRYLDFLSTGVTVEVSSERRVGKFGKFTSREPLAKHYPLTQSSNFHDILGQRLLRADVRFSAID